MMEVDQYLKDKNYDKVLDALNGLDVCAISIESFRRWATHLLECFYACHESEEEPMSLIAIKCLNLLKRACVRGELFQNAIVSRMEFTERIRDILIDIKGTVPENIRMNSIQLLANLCVQNTSNQERIITYMQTFLLTNLSLNGIYANASAMILYNGFIYKSVRIGLDVYLNRLLDNVDANRMARTELPEFVCIFLEYLVSESNEVVKVLEEIDANKKLLFLRYLIEYIREEDRRIRPVHPDIFKYMLTEFKTKCDIVLNNVNVKFEPHDTEEAYTLLIFIADATCVEPYGSFLRCDGSLFLTLGCLLRQMQMLGEQETKNMFTPVKNIEEILQIKRGKSDLNIEGQISYSLRSAVVKSLANMAYKSKKNQKLAREMGIIMAILECTNLDARNPLIKEWSILAIHNLCDGNFENQEFIAGLKNMGDAEKSLFTEYKSGTIRIGEGKPTTNQK